MSKLYRSSTDKKIFGLCGGLAQSFNIDVTILRLIFAIAAVFSAGTMILIYLVACLVIPKEETYRGGYGAYPPPQQEPFRDSWQPNSQQGMNNQAAGMNTQTSEPSQLDYMMKDIERKAMMKELEELRMKVAKLEQSNSKDEKGE